MRRLTKSDAAVLVSRHALPSMHARAKDLSEDEANDRYAV
jgi:hypothetical protein